MNSILTDVTGYDPSNIAVAPEFVNGYINGDRTLSVTMPGVITSMAAAAAFDEGGNFIDVIFGPLTPSGVITFCPILLRLMPVIARCWPITPN